MERPMIAVLGSVGVRCDRAEVLELGPRLQRLLAVLAVHHGGIVPTDRLIHVVWNGAPPPGAEGTLKAHVTRLRRALDPHRTRTIEHRSPGYALDVRCDLDSQCFEEHLEEGLARSRTGDHDEAVVLLRRSLESWRGPAYAAFAGEEWARPEAVRLEERKIEATETLIEALTAAGSVESAVAEARRLAAAEPLREQPQALLMRALLATGRRSDALRQMRTFRRVLRDETGLDPSDGLLDLERRIAQDDRTLSCPRRTIRSYVLAERLGVGGKAVVHRAFQPGVERDVAVKILRPELLDRPGAVRRFEEEARFVASIEHPHVVPIHDYWRERGAAYLVMRLMRGGSVESQLRARGPYSPRATVELLRGVGAALETVHRAGIVHRDVRPANVLLDENGAGYLSDFGLARPIGATGGLGSLAQPYAPPEVLEGGPATIAADVYSLGVTAFEMLTGGTPCAHRPDADLVRRRHSEPLRSVRVFRQELPAAVDQVLGRATATTAANRHATVSALVEDLVYALERWVGTRELSPDSWQTCPSCARVP